DSGSRFRCFPPDTARANLWFAISFFSLLRAVHACTGQLCSFHVAGRGVPVASATPRKMDSHRTGCARGFDDSGAQRWVALAWAGGFNSDVEIDFSRRSFEKQLYGMAEADCSSRSAGHPWLLAHHGLLASARYESFRCISHTRRRPFTLASKLQPN